MEIKKRIINIKIKETAMFRCPQCKNSIKTLKVNAAECLDCGWHSFTVNGYMSFISREDLPVQYDALQSDSQFLDHEGVTTIERFNRYFIPLINQSGFGENSKILCLGCGGGDDVETLIRAGFKNTIGIEIGWRSDWWKQQKRSPQHLFIADGRTLPFEDDCFDVIISLGVIEHVGAIGDSADLYPDYQKQRTEFIGEVCRTLAPKGLAIVACPNRLFPIDFQHNISKSGLFHDLAEKTGLSFHSPWEPMLLGYGDIKKYVTRSGYHHSVIPLKLNSYLGLNFRNSPFLKHFVFIFKKILSTMDSLPQSIRESGLNPYMLCAIKKK